MTVESASGPGHPDLAPYQEALQKVDELVLGGELGSAISLLQGIAKDTASEELAQKLVQLRVQAGCLLPEEIHPEPMFEANALLGDPSALQKRLASDGYLFFRNIVPVERLLEIRDQMTRILADCGWIKDGEDRMTAQAICRPRREGQPKFFQAHDQIVRLEALHSLAHEEHLMNVMRLALGDTAFPHPLCITRLVFPDVPELATPPHQDFPNNQGTPNLTAAWIPLGDCSMDDGSLAILESSNRFGVLPLDFHLGAGNRQAVLSEDVRSCRWVGADFKAGDIVLFGALTVHRALSNTNLERMRLSVDFRYQLEGEALTPICLKPHFERLSWEEIYKDWKSKDYQYYWQKKNIVEVPWNPALHELPDGDLFDAYVQELEYNVALTRRQEERAAKTQE